MKPKIKIGILGCANVAKRYAIGAFQTIDNAQLVALASRDEKKAKEWASQYHLEWEKSYEALLERKDIDAIYLPLPIGLHEKWVLKAAQAGKHIICEKSLADNFASVKKMVEACRKNELVLYENFMCDFHPQHEKVISLINQGEIGKPFVFKGYFGFPPMDKKSFRYDSLLGGGSLNDAGAYPIFMARKLFASEPLAVNCNLVIDSETNVDIQGSAHLEFPAQKAALVAFGFDNVYQNNYSIWGNKGLISVKRAYSLPPQMEPSIELIKNESFQEITTFIKVPPTNQFELIFHDFCETIFNYKQEKVNHVYSNILSQAKVLEAMRISALENRKIKIDEVK